MYRMNSDSFNTLAPRNGPSLRHTSRRGATEPRVGEGSGSYANGPLQVRHATPTDGISTRRATSGRVRVLVVGDTAVGKTLFLKRLWRACCTLPTCLEPGSGDGRCWAGLDHELPSTHWPSTVAFHVEAITCIAKASLNASGCGASTNSAAVGIIPVEFLEVGGSRLFGFSTRRPVLEELNFDGVIFMYNRASASSAAALVTWYDELRLAGLVGTPDSCKTILIGTVLSKQQSRAHRSSCQSDHSQGTLGNIEEGFGNASRVTPRECRSGSDLLTRMQHYVYTALAVKETVSNQLHPTHILSVDGMERRGPSWIGAVLAVVAHCFVAVERVLLFGMAVLLFGVNQDVVQWRQSSVRAAISTVRRDPNCIAEIHCCSLVDDAAFAECVDEVRGFLAALET